MNKIREVWGAIPSKWKILGGGAAAAGGLGFGAYKAGMYAHNHREGAGAETSAKKWLMRAAVAGLVVGAAASPGILGKKAATVGAGLFNTARSAVEGGELAARTILTGGIGGVKPFRQAWFPHLEEDLVHVTSRSMPSDFVGPAEELHELNLKKFAPNTSIIKRGLAIGAGVGVVSGMAGTMRNNAPPATVYWDGRQMRRRNDGGANATYAQKVLGNNSILNTDMNGFDDYGQTVRNVAHFF